MSHHLRMQELVLNSGCSWISQAAAGANKSNNENTTAPTGEDRPPGPPFQGLTICVTGLSKEARKQVQITTERLGGIYSPDLHSGCTHLVVQRSTGRKFEHALKNKFRKGLYVVTLAWFVNSARLNERLDESQFDAAKVPPEVEFAENSLPPQDDPTACMPQKSTLSSLTNLSSRPSANSNSLEVVPMGFHKAKKALFSGFCFYIDKDVPSDLQVKVVEAAVREGATCISDWYIGCNATHIVCEDHALLKYVGYRIHLISPIWLLRTVKDHTLHHLVHISLDLVRHIPFLLEQQQQQSKQPEAGNASAGKKMLALCSAQEDAKARQVRLEEAESKIRAARESIRRRRGKSIQPCRTLPRPITPSSMMESICWSISEPPSTAQLYLDNADGAAVHDQASDYFDAQESGKESIGGEVYLRPLNDSEKQDLIYKGVFLTILFPLDRYSEMGPSSKQFFNVKGFTRQQILEHVYAFYQEPLSPSEIEVAICTDSKHAERLRGVYAAPETLEVGYVKTKRYEFLGSRRNFEGLRRLSVEKNGQVYQLCLGS